MSVDKDENAPTDRARDTLFSTLSRSDDWDDACTDAAVGYAEALFAAGRDPDAVVRELDTVTFSIEHAKTIAHEAQTGERLPPAEDEDERTTKRIYRWLAIAQLLLGLALLTLAAFGAYSLVARGKPPRITSLLVNGLWLVLGLRWVWTFPREWREASRPPGAA